MRSLSNSQLRWQKNSNTACTEVTDDFDGDNAWTNEIRTHRPKQHVLGFNLSHWTPLLYKYSRWYPHSPLTHLFLINSQGNTTQYERRIINIILNDDPYRSRSLINVHWTNLWPSRTLMYHRVRTLGVYGPPEVSVCTKQQILTLRNDTKWLWRWYCRQPVWHISQ